MTRITSIRVLIVLASIHNLDVHQMDVKTAFLNGDLEEEIYMEQPKGCVVPRKEKKVCKLVKSLYGLKQAPKQWHNKFDHVLVTNGYSINDANKCIYNKYEDNTCVVICLYVDDMLIFGTSLEVVHETKKFLGSKFDMKDLGEAKMILGIKITRTPNGLKLSQEHYVEKILRKFEHFDCKPVSTPYDPSSQLKKNREHNVAQIEYAQIIGSLMYLMNCTRPDIAYANILDGFTYMRVDMGPASYENLGKFFGAFMNIQVRHMAYLCNSFYTARSEVEKTNVDKVF
ncbi:Retrovirus-related Pol polyprotein from transposon TNT 1-94 [Vitis vinifera]|uniref:Retrovirus-related Pol polyprotein from transposon TNT 1-94 n=1 Tax=Vitis vinifera TaxID=29760 RepID=A0A438GUR3_VITVI|nr:Retrovirus-related Pol polyprotein from transposon TNT 1-94 [Vitis vinifera]